MNTTFTREARYIVLKNTDVHAALSMAEKSILNTLYQKVAVHRANTRKPALQGVFVEHDWPEHDMVWAAIEARMTGATSASQESYITAEQARALGAGKVEYLNPFGNWCECPDSFQYPTWRGTTEFKYRAVMQPKLAPKLVTADDITYEMHQEWNTIFAAGHSAKDGEVMAAAINAWIKHRSAA